MKHVNMIRRAVNVKIVVKDNKTSNTTMDLEVTGVPEDGML